ncbi:MAG: hypothetical protein FJ098_02690, partial [Deltaproteobacteria bacterium]|nr:hypothetical protein [Deltaproteobacteria bacterium]
TLTFTVPPPPSNCSNPKQDFGTITGPTVKTGSGDTTGGGNSFTVRSPEDVVYKFRTGSAALKLAASLCGSSYDTYLFIRQGACSATDYNWSNDDNGPLCSGSASSISNIPLATNTDYWVWIDGYSGTGAYNLTLTFTSVCVPTVYTVGTYNGYCTNHPNSNPFYTWYTDNRHQLLYRASELQAAGFSAGPIDQWGFQKCGGTARTMQGFNLRFKHTSWNDIYYDSGSGTFDGSGFTTVWSGTYTPSNTNGWQYISFSTPFVWNGTSNVLIEICWDNTNYWSSPLQLYEYITNSPAFWSHTPRYVDGATGCSLSSPYNASNGRPVTRFRGCD